MQNFSMMYFVESYVYFISNEPFHLKQFQVSSLAQACSPNPPGPTLTTSKQCASVHTASKLICAESQSLLFSAVESSVFKILVKKIEDVYSSSCPSIAKRKNLLLVWFTGLFDRNSLRWFRQRRQLSHVLEINKYLLRSPIIQTRQQYKAILSRRQQSKGINSPRVQLFWTSKQEYCHSVQLIIGKYLTWNALILDEIDLLGTFFILHSGTLSGLHPYLKVCVITSVT